MKLPKTLLKAMAVAVTVSTVTACINDKLIKPKNGEPQKKQVPYNCPGCGMG